ncbi:hypothetical protein GOV05_03810 [Candidatus Woesearchaeota archaeon]|nr:hypothetical protein [Candidatus Woesearchaeota archaeon]
MDLECVRCKGRNFCGRTFCPLTEKISAQKKVIKDFKKDFSGEAPNVFVGRRGYPEVNVGFLSTPNYDEHDEPKTWSKKEYEIQKVIGLRSELVNSTFKTNIKTFNDKLLNLSREVSQATKPVDVEINLSKKPSFDMTFNQDITPHGPNVKLENISLTSNPYIPKKIDKVVSDDELKSTDAISYLQGHDYDEYSLTKLLSVGNLGLRKDRKLVPTRWAITAVDDTIGKNLYKKIVDHPVINDYQAYFGGHLGNHFLILLFPDVWGYELFETHTRSQGFVTDVEGYDGRKSYAHSTAGGYYASRLPIMQRLDNLKRQATVVVIRFITDDYWAPLGVWVVREAVRKALSTKPLIFDSKELMLAYAKKLASKKYNYNLNSVLSSSKLLKEKKEQKKLWEY